MVGLHMELVVRQHIRDLVREAERHRHDAASVAPPQGRRPVGGALRAGAAELVRRHRGKPVAAVLKDGRGIRVRRLRATDCGMYRRAVEALSPRSRYLRFGTAAPQVSEAVLARMMGDDDELHVVYVALTPAEDEMIGVARFVRRRDERSAEAAIAVADAWQGSGLGALLLEIVIWRARRAGLESLFAVTLSPGLAVATREPGES